MAGVVETIQMLSPDGTVTPHIDYPLEIDGDLVRTLYRDMVLMRRFDLEATALQRQGELGLFTPIMGQEAAQIGVGRAMRPTDYAFTTYREHGIGWCKGIEPLSLLKLFRGVTNGGWNPSEFAMAIYSIVIGDHVPQAVGYAMGVQRDGTDEVAVAFFGDGATSQGDVHEAFVFASVFHSPVLFYLQNNHLAISVPVERQAKHPLVDRADGYGIPGISVDGNDVLATLAVSRAALERIREGGGPMLIEAVTYRMGSHTTSDDPTRYRPPEHLEHWAGRDPIDRLHALMEREGWADQAFLSDLDAEADLLGSTLRDGCRALVAPPSLTMFDHVYAEPHQQIIDDRAFLAEYLSSAHSTQSLSEG